MTSDRTLRGIRQAAELIGRTDALLITAGAGMGVDSGLPDFRSKDGFWRAYPALRQRGISFERMAQPQWFFDDPAMAWAFYGHRQRLYRETKPHDGFRLLLEWGRVMPGEYFVATSNVDGQFEAAGFAAERLLEVHGRIDTYQCVRPCRQATWRDSSVELDVDLDALAVRGELPRCPNCGGVARPNVLMFGDGTWVSRVVHTQRGHYQHWLAAVRARRLVVVEVGAGKAIPTIRRMGEDLVAEGVASLVRINPEASESEEGVVPIKIGALEALQRIDELVRPAIARRSTVLSGARPVLQSTSPGSQDLPPSVAARAMETLDFPGNAERPSAALWLSVGGGGIDLSQITLVDLESGLVGPFRGDGITAVEEKACVDAWFGPCRDRHAPLPEIAGHRSAEWLLRTQAVRSTISPASERPAAALMDICHRDRRALMHLGVARHPLDGAALWRWIYEHAQTSPKPLEFPRVPWVVYCPGEAAAGHSELLATLKSVARVLAWTWFRLEAYYEQRGKRED